VGCLRVTITVNEPQRPSLEMLRQLTDRRVFEQLLEADSLTRAEIAARTGISKPTISESVRRLIDAGLAVESGRQSGGRGRAGTYCRLRTDTAAALAVSVGPDGILVDTFDLKNRPVAQVEEPVPAPVDGNTLEPLLLAAVRTAVQRTAGAVRSCVVSVAAPVDRRTGRLVHLSYSPFLVGEFDPRRILSSVAPVVEVDNDVNWAALAEHQQGHATDLDDFALCYLGAGIGGAVMVGGAIVGGTRGMAGELARALTTGPGGRSLRLFECFAAWDLLEPGSEAIDVPRVRGILEGGSAADRRRRGEIASAVAGALNAVVALLDPRGLLIGGPWGSAPGLIDLIADRIDPVAEPELILRPAALTAAPYRDGIRIRAVAAARQAVAGAF
jgi:predicted NBD/HSP70 family sugar kinase/biotin operon repressor